MFDDCMKQILIEFNKTSNITIDYLTDKLSNHSKDDIKYRLRRLREKGMIRRRPNVIDMRRVFYRLATLEEYYASNSSLSDFELRLFEEISNIKKGN
ncbi:MAG: hypothetical protein IH840_12600 [Candidatus Heimdallarchaeota archaeon]|nr:hypothetical protein [Candidatus Heimdallarchaeota archaeon]